MRCQGPFKICIDHAGLHHSESIGDTDIKDLVHPAHVQNNAALDRNDRACQTCSGPSSSDWESVLVGQD